MIKNRAQITDYMKDALYYLVQLLTYLIKLSIWALLVLSMDRMLSSMTPKWLLPWWAVVYVVGQFVMMYVLRYNNKWYIWPLLLTASIINYVIAYNYNPMTPAG